MKKLTNLQEPLRTPDGQPIPDTVQIMLSAMLYYGSSRDPARAVSLAQRIRESRNGIVLEESDYAMLSEAVQGDQRHANFARAACLAVIAAAEEVEPSEPSRAARRRAKKGK
jgi:hypothetical protein